MSFNERYARREEAAGASRVLTYGDVVSGWHRQKWDPFIISLEEDAATFSRATPEERAAIMLPVYHRISAENLVADLMSNLVLAAPSEEAALALATQQSDEELHVRSIVRICEEVFGIKGGLEGVLKLAEQQREPATEVGFQALRGVVEPLGKNSTPEEFLRGEVSYSWIGEGALARTAQYYTKDMAGFPGSKEGQRNVRRDEARHIQIGVIAAREALADNYPKARDIIMGVVDEAASVMHMAMQALRESGESDRYVSGYGVTFDEFIATAVKFVLMRVKSAGLENDALQLEQRLFGD